MREHWAMMENPVNLPASTEAPGPPASRPRSLWGSDLRAWVRDLLIAVALALVIIIFLYQPVKVEGTSMTPLLADQERIFINKFVYHYQNIQRGDIVVFWYPMDGTKSFIKRVVGLPGETVSIEQGHVLINGQAIEEPYVPAQFADGGFYGPMKVPDGHYFVMGDHRSSSNDSRVFGAVHMRHIYGKAVFSYWPVERFGSIPAFASTPH